MATLPDIGVILSEASRPTPDSLKATVWVDSGAGYNDETTLDFCPYAVCTSIIAPGATSVALSTTNDFYSDMITVGDYALINSEIVEITAFGDTTLGIKRGCLDTVPTQHAAGSKFYVLSTYNGVGSTEYVVGETVNVKLTPVTGKGVLALSSAPSSSVTMNRRALRPYPPGAWSISGSQFPTQIIDTPLTTAWAHRSRTQQTGANLVDFSEGSIGPEAGTTYSLRLYNHDTSALLHSVDSVAGTSYSSLPTMTGMYNLRLELWSVRGGLASLYKHSHVFYYENVYRLTLENGSGRLLTETNDILTTE
jgi:hypothetical protein